MKMAAKPGEWRIPVIPGLRKLRQENYRECEGSLGFRVNFRPIWATA